MGDSSMKECAGDPTSDRPAERTSEVALQPGPASTVQGAHGRSPGGSPARYLDDEAWAGAGFLERWTGSQEALAVRVEPFYPWRTLRVWGEVELITGHSAEDLAGPLGMAQVFDEADVECLRGMHGAIRHPTDRARFMLWPRNAAGENVAVITYAWGVFAADGTLSALEAVTTPASNLLPTSESTHACVHDVNNLIAAALCAVEITRRPTGRPSRDAPALDVAMDALERAAGLLRHATRSGAPSSKGPVDLNDAVTEVLPILRTLLGPGAQIRDSLSRGQLIVRGAAADFDRVLVNLVANARDAFSSAHGTVTIRTYLRDHDTGRSIVLEVADDGPGIPEENLARVFEPGFSTKEQGSGLGLAIARDIVAGLGGSVEVESSVGSGATFRIVMPRVG